ncbi:hypothetical protein GWI33_010914 [Rhynchophorus ferrugineus]|uniref:Uncharacterized protein n=1 Tax=Rhynchophorus ferrugineus TaxID=354439 RepID=A0A834ICJ6_RHYFE|nr:hypothetical protein GWI33_010914 [Rhynchophorus ferrugineus]
MFFETPPIYSGHFKNCFTGPLTNVQPLIFQFECSARYSASQRATSPISPRYRLSFPISINPNTFLTLRSSGLIWEMPPPSKGITVVAISWAGLVQ